MKNRLENKVKLLNRIRRIKGQITAIEQALADDQKCITIIQAISACRGAIHGLMNEIMQGHIRSHIGGTHKNAVAKTATEEFIEVLKSYLQ